MCGGCGAAFQNLNSSKVGFIPLMKPVEHYDASKIKELQEQTEPLMPAELKLLLKVAKKTSSIPICQKCHSIQKSGKLRSISLKTNRLQFGDLKIKDGGLVFMVLDLMDLPNSIVHDFTSFTGDKELIVLLNKADLMPDEYNWKGVKSWIRSMPFGSTEKKLQIIPVSAVTGFGMDQYQEKFLAGFESGQDSYMIGCTNVGKSSIMNYFKKKLGHDDLFSTAHTSGTTAGLLKISSKELVTLESLDIHSLHSDKVKEVGDERSLIDTAGIIQEGQLCHFFNATQMKYLVAKTKLRLTRISIDGGEVSIYIAGLGRMDISGNALISFVLGPQLRVQKAKLGKLPKILSGVESKFPKVLFPTSLKDRIPLGFPPLQPAGTYESVSGDASSTTYWISCLGWFTVKGDYKFTLFLPSGKGLYVTNGFSLLPGEQ